MAWAKLPKFKQDSALINFGSLARKTSRQGEPINKITMIQNYFKLALRHLMADKLASGINILGMSIAIGMCITVYLFLRGLLTADHFHANGEHIYMVEHTIENEGETETWGIAPALLAPALEAQFPQVERAARVENEWVKVYAGQDVFEEKFSFADTAFFSMFSFPLLEGKPAALARPGAVVISYDLAEKLFPDENAMGKTITVGLGLTEKKVFTVGGVAQKFPGNTGLRFSILAGYEQMAALGRTLPDNWAAMAGSTFVQLKPGAKVAALEKSMAPFVEAHNAANPDLKILSFVFDNLKNPNPGAYKVIRRPTEALHPLAYWAFGGIAGLMFALSCFNYINISLSQAAKRLKEIGIRKAVGGRKAQLVWQFMSENLLLCSIAFLFGLALTSSLFIPFFNNIFVEKISLDFSGGIGIWLFMLVLLLFTGVASGAYPALYVSSFQAASIFRGKSSFSTKSKLTKVLLCLQFVLAFSTVITGVLVVNLAEYWKKMPWGYQPEQTLVVRLDEPGQFEKLRNEALRNPNITHIGSAASHVGESLESVEAKIGRQEKKIVRYEVGAGYFEAMGLQLAQGRFFDANRIVEDELSVVVNEALLAENEAEAALGGQIHLEGKAYNIAGVVNDFKMLGTAANRPCAFFLSPADKLAYLALRYKPGAGAQVESFMKTAWEKLGSSVPFLFFHQELVFDAEYQAFDNLAKAFTYLAGLALLIACMGLFGLASQNYATRLKESGIRKVLGASVRHIILKANRSFISLLLVASMLATGICFGGFLLFLSMAEEFTGEVRHGVFPYLLANGLVFAAATLAVGWQSYRLAKAAPADSLRVE